MHAVDIVLADENQLADERKAHASTKLTGATALGADDAHACSAHHLNAVIIRVNYEYMLAVARQARVAPPRELSGIHTARASRVHQRTVGGTQ